jgi:hypothetical protein
MRPVLTIILFFTIALSNRANCQPSSSRLSVFTYAVVPDDLKTCGDDCFLSVNDKKQHKLICRTDYDKALIQINGKSIILSVNKKLSGSRYEEAYSNDRYVVLLKMMDIKKHPPKYSFSGTLTIKLDGKVLNQKKVIGDGGC